MTTLQMITQICHNGNHGNNTSMRKFYHFNRSCYEINVFESGDIKQLCVNIPGNSKVKVKIHNIIEK